MTDELPVHIGREELHGLEVPTSFEVTGPFDVRLINHGKSVHVHLHLDDDLSQVGSIGAGNHYVEGESERSVRVDLNTDGVDDETLLGKLKVVTAYGANTRLIDIEVTEPTPEDESVRVDESLAEPQVEAQEPTLIDRPELPVLVISGIALLVAVLTALLVDDTRILGGTVVVLAGVVVALLFLLQEQ